RDIEAGLFVGLMECGGPGRGPEDWRAGHEERMKEARAKLLKELTAEQGAKWQAMTGEEFKGRVFFPGPPGGHFGPPPGRHHGGPGGPREEHGPRGPGRPRP